MATKPKQPGEKGKVGKKHVKYYLVVDGDHSLYTKAESDLTFSDKEGKDFLKDKYPNATSITKISNKKAKFFLGLASIK